MCLHGNSVEVRHCYVEKTHREALAFIDFDLPGSGALPEIAKRLESGMKTDKIRDVRSACKEFLVIASDFYEVPTCGVRVLAARPLRTREYGTFEPFGDYTRC